MTSNTNSGDATPSPKRKDPEHQDLSFNPSKQLLISVPKGRDLGYKKLNKEVDFRDPGTFEELLEYLTTLDETPEFIQKPSGEVFDTPNEAFHAIKSDGKIVVIHE